MVEHLPPERIAELGKLAEDAGLGGVWVSNMNDARDPFINFVDLARATSRIRLGPIAVSPFELHPLKMASSLLTLNEAAKGRKPIDKSDLAQFANALERTLEALQVGRVTVFTLDTTDADAHTLDAGLISVAEHTGGFFRRTHLFSRAAMRDLAGDPGETKNVATQNPDIVRDLEARLVAYAKQQMPSQQKRQSRQQQSQESSTQTGIC